MKKRISVLLMISITISFSFAQASREGRTNVGTEMEKSGNCTTIALSEKGGIVGVTTKNGFTYDGIPMSLYNQLRVINADAAEIYDIHTTESGKWIIVGDSIWWSDGLPQELIDQILNCTSQNETISCVTFNDQGEWVIITNQHFYATDDIYRFITQEDPGYIFYVHIGPKSVILTSSTGIKSNIGWNASIIQRLSNRLDEIDYSAQVVKLFYDGSYYIGNNEANRSDFYF